MNDEGCNNSLWRGNEIPHSSSFFLKSYNMKQIYIILTTLLLLPMTMKATEGWPQNYNGVMLQAFYWDSFDDTKWTNLTSQAAELGQYFDLVWLPQSGNCGGTSMGYDDLYWFTDYNSSFGNKEELLSLIRTFKAHGIGTIADIVINHRRNVSNWVDFPAETYNGVTYQLKSTDIVHNDDNGKTLNWANSNGYSLSNYDDTGEGWDGMRDLDHKSANVQASVKAYLKMLLNDFGYAGFRYDMVKGYSPEYTAMYNDYAQPQFSVGECWDGTNTIRRWIDGTKLNGTPTSAAFDFQFRYTVRNAANTGNWLRLGQQNDGNWPLIAYNYEQGKYRQWAVTFVENHDTERRHNAAQDPLTKDTLAANAYLLAMPGTPCVFLTHWQDCKQDIKAMIDVRKAAGIHNQSIYSNLHNNAYNYANRVNGTKGNLIVVVGSNPDGYIPDEGYQLALSGYHFRYYLSNNLNTAWIDLASGNYEGVQTATLTAISEQPNAQLVYTTDGTTPTSSSKRVASGTKIEIPAGTTTLQVGLLIGSTVSGIVSRTYTIEEKLPFNPYEITVYVNTNQVKWSGVNFWTWGGDGTHSPANSNWPGDKVSSTITVEGKEWYAKSYTIHSEKDCVNFVFSTSNGSPQTIDINDVREDRYFEISTTKQDGKNTVNDLTKLISDIHEVKAEDLERNGKEQDSRIYDLKGRVVSHPVAPGIYIRGNKKYVVK